MPGMKSRAGPNGVHLFDRSSGLNILFDETPAPAAAWSRAPRYLSIALTNACELACPYCYAPKVAAKLASGRVLGWARELDAGGAFGMGFGGGEPTLYPGFAALCATIHAETELALTMTTHGHRFTTVLVEQLCGSVDFIRLSMDGVGATYERLRGRPFETFKQKLALVRETAKFGVNYVVNADTIDDLPRAADFVFAEGARELLLLPETGPGGALALEPMLMERLSHWVGDNYERIRLATSAHAIAGLDAPALAESQAGASSYDFMHVDAQGRLKVCAFDRDGFEIGGSILETIEAVRSILKEGVYAEAEGGAQ